MQSFAIKISGYDITNIVMLLAGALITAALSYLVASKREKKALKLKIQIDTAETMQKLIKEYFNACVKIKLYHMPLLLYGYNLSVDRINSIRDIQNILHDSQDQLAYNALRGDVQRIIDSFLEWDKNFKDYMEAFFSITFFIELRQMVLKKFIHFHRELLECFNILHTKRDEINKVRIEITALLSTQHIDKDSIEKLKATCLEYHNSISDIDMYMHDLQIGLQNEFYKKIFNRRLSTREPGDPNIKVLVPKKSNISILS